jgi:adenosylcobalamin-dependent ribonucleoside-triphosphate reductase
VKELFHLTDSFLEEYKKKSIPWGPLGYVTYKRTYARPLYDENRTEEWWETVKRVVEGTYAIQKWHCKRLKLPWNDNKAQKSAQEMYRLMFEMKFLPPGRGLWMMGTDYVFDKGGAALNNCAFVSTKEINIDFAEPFTFLMDMSMLGVGVGGDTKGVGLVKIRQQHVTEECHIVADSREGWVDIVRRWLNAYVGKGTIPTSIDWSQVRPYGAPIKGFGGTSSGPEPLKQLLCDIDEILQPLIGSTITGPAIVDLFNAIGKCVVSGNVRRSAEIMFGSPEDAEFLDLKNRKAHPEFFKKNDKGEWIFIHPWRWASNNSIFAKVGMSYKDIAKRIAENGEPGVLWLDTARQFGRMCEPANNVDELAEGANPCAEQTLESYELCCLVETFPARHKSYEEYERTLKFAYLYAKTVTLLPTHNERTNAVLLRNRRIGTSQSGIVQSFAAHGVRGHFEFCDKGYKYIRDLDRIYSRWLCVPESIKVTSVKPSGTVSLLPGATPGIHFPYAEYYWRTMRMDSGSQLAAALRKSGYRVIDLPKEGNNTCVVYFPVKEENYYKGRSDVTMWEQLELAAQMQHYWADNQVSITVTFKPEEAPQIEQALSLYETRLKSVSFLPLEDHGYEHAPYQPMSKEEYETEVKKLKPIRIKDGTDTQGFEHKFCDSEVCELPKK